MTNPLDRYLANNPDERRGGAAVSALDELRAALEAEKRSVSLRDADTVRYYDHGVNEGLRMAADALDRFVAERPGLVDETRHCVVCGKPTVPWNAYKEGRMGRWVWELCCSPECAAKCKEAT